MQHIININSSSRSRDSIKFFNKKSALQQWSHFTRHFIIIFASLVSLGFHIASDNRKIAVDYVRYIFFLPLFAVAID